MPRIHASSPRPRRPTLVSGGALRSGTLAAALLAPAVAPPAHAQDTIALPVINVDSTRLLDKTRVVGAPTTVITAEDIARSPALTLQEIIAQVPGAQVRSFSGAAAQTSVDLRGFGAFGTANTLVLINGRRLNDLDLAGVDLTTIPRDSIERIEVTRGNAGAALYGDNAVGGVINIVTKTGAGRPPSARMEVGAGSFQRRDGNISVAASNGPYSASAFGNAVESAGYRVNNAFDQLNGIGDVRYRTPDFTAFATISGDSQHLGLPGARIVDPTTGVDQLVTDRRGTATPRDYADKRGANATLGFSKVVADGAELIVDGGVRRKEQQAGFFTTFAEQFVDTGLTTLSFTPRLKLGGDLMGVRSDILTGVDVGDARYDSARSQFRGLAPIHVYDLRQGTLAGYWQQTLGLLPSTDFSYSGRVQQTRLDAKDTFDPAAAGAFGTQALPLHSAETNYAWHVGLEHRLNEYVAVFASAARAFRTPNVDERLTTGPGFDPVTFAPIPQTFVLRTQTSHDVEGGVRLSVGRLAAESSVYDMRLRNEIHFDPVNFLNYNLAPTHRYGSETAASLRVSDAVLLRGAFAYTRAVFAGGPFAGNDIPLVSRYTASGGVSWNIWERFLVLDATVRYWSSRRLDNDQANTQPLIPQNATVDLKIGGAYENFFWSLSVSNLFDVAYYDYGVASAFVPGRFNAYPLPGRTFLARIGAAL